MISDSVEKSGKTIPMSEKNIISELFKDRG